jgi:O-antigen/teichoic acid export membrane protein
VASLRANILANYAGQAWIILMGLAFVPLYLRVLGVEAFGLISFMLSLLAVSQILDLGIGGAVNRELARRAHQTDTAQGMRDLVRSFECVIWPIATLIALSLWLASPGIAGHWLHPKQLTMAETTRAVAIMAVAIAAFWPSGFYGSALSGLEKQGSLNLVNAVFATLRAVGVVPIILYVSATASAFIAWYALVGVLHSATLACLLWRKIPASGRHATPRMTELRGVWRFAGGLFAIGILSLGLSQFDRLALSALRPLEELGYYGLAISVAAGLGRLVLPVFNALYPRLSRLVAAGQQEQLVELYHLSSQYLAVVVAAIATVLVFFSYDVLYLWTGNAAIAGRAAVPLAILAAGSAINGMMNIPYALQLAHGWTRLTIVANSAILLLAFPYCLWAIPRYGMTGAAGLWLAANLCSFVFALPRMHKRLLRGELAAWYLRDLLPPVMAAAVTALVARAVLPALTRTPAGLGMFLAVCMLTLAAAALSAPATRRRVLGQIVGRNNTPRL